MDAKLHQRKSHSQCRELDLVAPGYCNLVDTPTSILDIDTSLVQAEYQNMIHKYINIALGLPSAEEPRSRERAHVRIGTRRVRRLRARARADRGRRGVERPCGHHSRRAPAQLRPHPGRTTCRSPCQFRSAAGGRKCAYPARRPASTTSPATGCRWNAIRDATKVQRVAVLTCT
jgi:hypothetical protein